ncbi:MAG: hypothetical protein U9N63_04685 [Pseudomonadota bacterium]|nr:hypothetical protein [Pseudomonadota bacterium]
MSFPTQVFRTLPILALALVIVATITILYSPGLDYPFFFDDYNSLMNDQGKVNNLIKNPSQSLDNLLAQPLRPDRNLTWLSFAASYQVNEMSPAGFRLINLILHGLCSILVYLILSTLLFRHSLQTTTISYQCCWPALVGTLFFLCHPLALNTVLYISQRFGALAAFFYLCGFYAWLKGKQSPTETSATRHHWLWFPAAGLAFWGALHSKEMAVTLPFTIMIYETYTSQPQPGNRKKILVPLALLVLMAAAIFLYAFKVGLFNQSWINIGFCSKRLWSPGIQFLSEARAFFQYWKLLFLPLPQSLSLHHEFSPSLNYLDPAALLAIIGHILLLVTAWKIRRLAPLLGFGIFWFYLVLGPPYLFLPQKELLVEYKTYLATPGAALMICGLLATIKNRLNDDKRTLTRYFIYSIIGCGLLLLTTITWQRRSIFQSPITLWSDVLLKYPASRRALNNRAVAHLKNQAPDKALSDLNTLVEKHTNYARGFENRGRLRLYLKDYQGAFSDLQKTLDLLPDEPELINTRNEIEKLKTLAQRAAKREKMR